ncbi:MAG TPA: OmpA family protein [Verrucomicrobiae bacterium]|nr:OmpA family protein [Verrucomicrobiae bacterium]
MRSASAAFCAVLFSTAWPALSQEAPGKANVPIYNVTVVERSTKAINYAYRGGPTRIDFRGTVLLPRAKGEATVESLRGRTEIDAKFENLLPTQRFGREYLTYSLWAITPQGAAHNIGEIVPDGSNKAKLHVTTDLQAFGLIVTAEPYSAARKPSDVVVMENEIRPDTIGKIETIDAKYELLPRGHYTWEVPAKLSSDVAGAPKVSMSEYEAILELFEAQNAVGIARAAGAGQYAPDTLAKAEQELEQARQLKMSKAPTNNVVELARESAQTAEDARVLTDRRITDQKLASAQSQVTQARQAQLDAQSKIAQAQAETAQARADADAARAQGEADRQARVRAEAAAANAQAQLSQAQTAPPPASTTTVVVAPPGPSQEDMRRTETRRTLCRQLSGDLPTLDTPRGIVVTVPDTDFNGGELKPGAAARVAQLVAPLASYPDLQVSVEGYSDSLMGVAMSQERADSVRSALTGAGMQADRVTARGMGDARPVDSKSTETGRQANRRVEIVISGNAIGTQPVWDKSYSVLPK